jgi:hypothetical protein
VIGHHDPENGVTKELQSLVGGVAGVLRTPGSVDQRRRQEVGSEVDAEALDQILESGYREGDQNPYSRPTT